MESLAKSHDESKNDEYIVLLSKSACSIFYEKKLGKQKGFS
jgi:hypothetical protein